MLNGTVLIPFGAVIVILLSVDAGGIEFPCAALVLKINSRTGSDACPKSFLIGGFGHGLYPPETIGQPTGKGPLPSRPNPPKNGDPCKNYRCNRESRQELTAQSLGA